jgi:WD40 repeat protein
MAAAALSAAWPAHKCVACLCCLLAPANSVLRRGGARALVFSADGSVLYTGGADGHIRAWAAGAEWRAASPVFALPAAASTVHALALSGARLFSAARDGAVSVWNASDGTREAALEPRSGAALALAVAGSTLAVSFAGVVLLWSSAPPFALKLTLRSVGCACGALALTADGSLLFTGGADGRVAAWRTTQDERSGVQSGYTLGSHDAAVSALALSPDGTRLFTACGSGEVRAYSVRRDGLGVLQTAGALVASWRTPSHSSVRALAAASARAGAAVAFSGGDDGVVRAWAPPPCTLSAGSDALAPRATDWMLSLAVWHAGGDAEALLAAGGADGVCRVWRVGALLVRASAPTVQPAAASMTLASGVPPPPLLPRQQADEHEFPVPLREERAAAKDALLREQDAYRARAAAFARAQQAASPSKDNAAQPAAQASSGWRGGFGLDRQQAALARMYGPHAVAHSALANAGMLHPGAAMQPAYGAAQSLPAQWGGGPPLPLAPDAAWAAGTGADGFAYGAPPYGAVPVQTQGPGWGQGSSAAPSTYH